jgi:glycosyltransferase involved in cell wall biosynthesis
MGNGCEAINPMKINWFSPLLPEKTDIAHYTTRILTDLTAQSDITLWTAQKKRNADVNSLANVVHYSPQEISWKYINSKDVSIYHIGNSYHFHSDIWEVSKLHSGITVIHDISLQHLFAGIFREQKKDKHSYLSYMSHYYGKKGLEASEVFWKGGLTTEYMATHFPLTELALENAMGVVVHSKAGFNKLKKKNKWPILYLPLPYSPQNKLNKHVSLKKQSPPYRLVIFGYIGTNRCLTSIFQALAQLPEKSLFQLHIYGELWDEFYIKKKIRELSLGNIVHIPGFVPEKELDRALSTSHLAFNLRNPSMGEASGSQLRIWDHALPSIVSKNDWYATLPSETVAFVSPDHEIEGVKYHLKYFLKHPEDFTEMGRAGQKHLIDHHNPENYVRGLLEFVKQTVANCSVTACHNMAKVIADAAYPWLSDELISFLKPAANEILKLSSLKKAKTTL